MEQLLDGANQLSDVVTATNSMKPIWQWWEQLELLIIMLHTFKTISK